MAKQFNQLYQNLLKGVSKMVSKKTSKKPPKSIRINIRNIDNGYTVSYNENQHYDNEQEYFAETKAEVLDHVESMLKRLGNKGTF